MGLAILAASAVVAAAVVAALTGTEQPASASASLSRTAIAIWGYTMSGQADVPEDLTPRENDVLALMAEGRSNTAIAQRLVVGEGAIGKHIANIFAKLDLPPCEVDNRRVRAVLAYLNHSHRHRSGSDPASGALSSG